MIEIQPMRRDELERLAIDVLKNAAAIGSSKPGGNFTSSSDERQTLEYLVQISYGLPWKLIEQARLYMADIDQA